MWRWRVEHGVAFAAVLGAVLCPRALWDRMRLPVAQAQDQVAERVAHALRGAGDDAAGAHGDAPPLAATEVRRELASVRAELIRAEAERAELTRLLAQSTALAKAVPGLAATRALPVRVRGASEAVQEVGPRAGRVRLDAGLRSGVRVPAPLVLGAALVGRLTAAADGASEAELVTATPFRVRSRNVRTGGEGISRGAGLDGLRFRPDGAKPDLREGDAIVTSAWGAFAPGGLAVGRVSSVERDPETGLVEARLAPAADLAGIERAFVILPEDRP